ncbi:hypothetical protein ACHAWX_003316 [Stephanocyclus meneghinianus]
MENPRDNLLGQIDLGGINSKGEDVLLIDFPLDVTNIPAWMVGQMCNEAWTHFADKINLAYKDSSNYWFRQAHNLFLLSLPLMHVGCPIGYFISVVLFCVGQREVSTRLNKIGDKLQKICHEQTLLCPGLVFHARRELGDTNNGSRTVDCFLYYIHVLREDGTNNDENPFLGRIDTRSAKVLIGNENGFGCKDLNVPMNIEG